jgi:DNA polymerase I-like protein with 3'-5' exonuclease and polymerase domains
MNQLNKSETGCSTKRAHIKQKRRCNELVKHIIRFHAVHTLISTVTLFDSKFIKEQMIYETLNRLSAFKTTSLTNKTLDPWDTESWV